MTHQAVENARGYIICSEARSGTTWFGRLLRSTLCLGLPREVFSDAARIRRICADPDYFQTLLAEASTPNGIYGFKLMSDQLDRLSAAKWVSRLPAASFVWIERRDVLGQAISTVRAAQTEQYRTEHEIRRPAFYDCAAIDRAVTAICHGQARWRDYFARNGIEPLRLAYEDILAAPQTAVVAIADLMDVAGPIPEASSHGAEIQRDDLSLEWRRRFLNDRRDLDAMPGLPFSPRAALRDVGRRLGLVA